MPSLEHLRIKQEYLFDIGDRAASITDKSIRNVQKKSLQTKGKQGNRNTGIFHEMTFQRRKYSCFSVSTAD